MKLCVGITGRLAKWGFQFFHGGDIKPTGVSVTWDVPQTQEKADSQTACNV